MTEQEIRQQVVSTIRSWLGAKKGDATHHQIIDVYNSHKPLPRGVRMSYSMDWCAATVSAAGIANSLTDIMPVECSCGSMVNLYQQMGRWVEDDDYTPKPGDVIFYAWGDDGRGDCTKAPNHVGIVVNINGDAITVMEGNMGKESVVGSRRIARGGRYVRGYGIPDYAAKADKPPVVDPEPKKPWYAAARAWAQELGLSDGTGPEDGCTRAEVWAMLKRYHEAAVAARGGK